MKAKCLVCAICMLVLWACYVNFPTTIETKYGKVKGFLDDNNTLAWKSIPYARPPVGELRWKAPKDPASWEGILDATKDCQECTQMGQEPITYASTDEVIGSEDCLYLNIWRPQAMTKDLPVYFWIHGGANNNGSIKDYDGSVIAKRSNMVVVTIQYRLGVFGWLTHPAMRQGESSLDDSGNFGTLDTIKALEWVQDNIKSFGGDPNNIIVAGESAGAHNVMNLVISPLAEGLFHKAIVQSDGMKTYTIDYGDEWTENTIENLLADDALNEVPDSDVEGYLRGKTAEELILARYCDGRLPFSSAYQDGSIIPEGGVIPAIESGNYNKIPLILGSNKDEMKFLLPPYGLGVKGAHLNPDYGISVPIPSSDYTWFDLHDVLNGSLSLTDVLPTDEDKTLYQACAEFGSINLRYNFVDAIAGALKEQQEEVYAYLFKWDGVEGSDFNFIFGAAHTLEIAFFFGNDTDISFGGFAFNVENDTSGRQALSKAMMKYVANFARTGDPNGFDLPTWEKWSNEKGESKVIVFDATEKDSDIDMISEEITSDDVDTRFSHLYSTLPVEVRNVLYWFDWY